MHNATIPMEYWSCCFPSNLAHGALTQVTHDSIDLATSASKSYSYGEINGWVICIVGPAIQSEKVFGVFFRIKSVFPSTCMTICVRAVVTAYDSSRRAMGNDTYSIESGGKRFLTAILRCETFHVSYAFLIYR
jgi:hypothetical protein